MPRKKAADAKAAYNPAEEPGFKKDRDAALIRFNAYGVRAVFMRSVTDSHWKMAGYMGLPSSKPLLDLCAADRDAKGPLAQFVLQWQASFGVTSDKAEPSRAISWDANELLDYLLAWKKQDSTSTKEALERNIQTLTVPLDPTEHPAKNRSRGLLSTAVLLHRAYKALPDAVASFAGTAGYTDDALTVAGMHMEDWFRMFALARYYKGRYVQYAREQEDKAGKARPRDERAGVMYYLSDDDIGGHTDDAAQQLANNIGLAEAWGGLQTQADDTDDADFDDVENLAARAETLELSLVDRDKNPRQVARGEWLRVNAVSLFRARDRDRG
jgi:hypothetical protein